MKIRIYKGYNRIVLSIFVMLCVEINVYLNTFLMINLPILRYILATIALYLLLSGIWQIRLKWKHSTSLYFVVITSLLTFWNVGLIYKGLPLVVSGYSNHLFLKQFISGQLLLYLLPLILLVEPSEIFIGKLFKFAYYLSLIYLFAIFPFSLLMGIGWHIYYFLEQSAYYFAAPAGILLLTSPYHSKKVKLLSYITIGIALVIVAYLGRRTSVAYYGSILLFTVLIINFSSSALINKRRVLNLFSTVVFSFIILVALIFNLNKFSTLSERSASGFSNRELVFLEYIIDMDKNPRDWIVGRGINGTFKSHLGTNKNGQRDGIENGYLQAILKGGYVYLGFMILLSLGAIINGFFNSKNILSKAAAAFIFIQFIEMIGFGLPSLSLKYILFWIGIGICYYKPLLKKSDLVLKPLIRVS